MAAVAVLELRERRPQRSALSVERSQALACMLDLLVDGALIFDANAR